MITVYSRIVNGKKGEWEFHSSYVDGLPGGKKREKEYANNFKKKENNTEYKVEVDNEWFFGRHN